MRLKNFKHNKHSKQSKQLKINKSDLLFFIQQLAVLQKSGIPMIQSLDLIAENTSRLFYLVSSLKQTVGRGFPLSVALKKETKIFNALFCGMIEIGEHSGTLDIILEELYHYYEKQTQFTNKLRASLIYPMVVLMVGIIVVFIMLLKVVPTFKALFKGMSATSTALPALPVQTEIVLQLSDFCQQYGLGSFGFLSVFILILIYFYRRSSFMQNIIHKQLFKFPLIRSLLKHIFFFQFTKLLSIMSRAGVPLMEALEMVSRSFTSRLCKTVVQTIQTEIRVGSLLHTAMKRTQFFPTILIQMVKIGEESGTLEDILSKMSGFYEDKVLVILSRFTTLLEPFIMILLGLGVGILVFALYCPIFEMGAYF